MTDRPIVFSAPMVRALLDGRKHQTRRALKPQPRLGLYGDGSIIRDDYFVWEPKPGHVIPFTDTCAYQWRPRLPYAPGDRLWVRETFTKTQHDKPVYRADATDQSGQRWHEIAPGDPDGEVLWRPSIHMPRWASRLTLIVTDVRVQRLQDISEDDCEYEGAGAIHDWDCRLGYDTHSSFHPDQKCDCGNEPAQAAFGRLWDSLNGKKPGCAWADNPWCCVLTFTVHRQNIDYIERESAA